MCGLFGLLRSPTALHPDRASVLFIVLGELAEERGLDAAGVAFLNASDVTLPSPPGWRADARLRRCPDVQTAQWRIVKDRQPFTALWTRRLDGALDGAQLVLGHTRWATQGSTRLLANASPLLVDGVIGTHNGDIDAAALRARFALPRPLGGTDSEVIFQALAQHNDPVPVLTALRGRAALAWVEVDRPDRVHLARAALSPLAVALDAEANLYWASNPRWLRTAAQIAGVRLKTVRLLTEGTLTTVACAPRMHIVARERFVATARPVDTRLTRAVWRGFDAADKAADVAQARHEVCVSRRWQRAIRRCA